MEENVCCFCCGKSSKDDKQSKTKGSTCCFFRKKSPKDEPPRKREDGLANNLYLRKRTKRKLCCFSCIRSSSKEASRIKGEGCLSCFCCGKSSVEERDQGGGGKGTKRSRFISTKSLASCIPFGKEGERSTSKSPKKMTSCLPCFKSKKTSEKTPCFPCLKSETSCFPCFKLEKTSCFPCFKSSDKVVSRKEGERLASISPKKSACCFPCFKVSNNTESRTRGDRSRNTSPRARFSKCGFVNMIFCSSCFKKANGHRRSKPGKKKRKHKALPPSPRINISATEGILHIGSVNLAARVFTYSELAAATHNFNPKFRLGKGGFGRVYKGTLKDTEQVVAVKQLEKNENQGNRDFLYEVLMLSLLDHPNLISLRGYCVEGDERLLVYDYMALGSLQDHLLDLSPNSKPMDWNTRMKIAAGAAKGLQFLHDVAFPPVIYGELKASNILIDEDFNAKLSDFGIAKASPAGSKRVTGTGGYSAPEYALTGKLTKMSDVYSFGIMLLEIISGRKAMDSTRPSNEQRLVDWALHLFMDEKRLVQLADPLLEGNFSVKELFQAIAVAVQCLQEEDTTRPQITDVVSALESLTVADSENLMEEQAALGPHASVISVDSHIEITSEHTEDEEPEQEEGEEQGEQEKEEEEEEEKVGEDEDEDPSWLSHSYWEICSIASEDE